MSLENEYIDDFYVASHKDNIPLSKRLEYFRLVNEKYRELSPSLRNQTTRAKMLNALISEHRSNSLYRKHNDASDLLINYWVNHIRQISLIYGESNNISSFQGITKDFVKKIIELSEDVDNLLRIDAVLEKSGIILIVDNSISGLKADGVVFLNGNNQAVIGLSLRFSRLDNFWFTLIHELSHLVLHYDQLHQPIIDDLEQESDDIIERQANKLAKDLLIPRNVWRNLQRCYHPDKGNLLKFSRELKVHPAILAGLLRYDLNNFTLYSDIVNSINTREILGV